MKKCLTYLCGGFLLFALINPVFAFSNNVVITQKSTLEMR